jgi:hypothetical protein
MKNQNQIKNMLICMKKQAEVPERKRTEAAKAICNLMNSVDGKY